MSPVWIILPLLFLYISYFLSDKNKTFFSVNVDLKILQWHLKLLFEEQSLPSDPASRMHASIDRISGLSMTVKIICPSQK